MSTRTSILERLDAILTNVIEPGIDEISDSENRIVNLSENLPEDVKKIFKNADFLNQHAPDEFLGYMAISFTDVLSGIHPIRSSKVASGLVKPPDGKLVAPIYLLEDINGVLNESVEITDFDNLFPIFEFEGNYIFYYKSDTPAFVGLISTLDSLGYYVAPSLKEHVLDLIEGIQSGIYPIDGDEVVFPSSWHNRLKLKAGLVEMDQYGNISDLN